MTTQTATLSDFLLARLAEDEAAARAAAGKDPRWFAVPSRMADEGDADWFVRGAHVTGGEPDPELSLTAEYVCSDSGWMDDDTEDHAHLRHIARHDPARVLAQVAALRAVVELHVPLEWGVSGPPQCSVCAAWDETDWEGPPTVDLPCPTLRALAQAWASHPAFDPAWSA